MLIAQISDTHITAPGTNTCGVAPMADNLERCITHINQLEPKPDVVLLTGDVTNGGTVEEARHAAQLLTKLESPFYVIPGNHDAAGVLSLVFGEAVCPAGDYVLDNGPVRLIGMDSTDPGKPGGKITAAQAEWLEGQLANEPDKPTIIFIHHPPVKCSVIESDEDGFIGADLLGQVVAGFSNIERILCGHIHLLVHARWHGTIVTTAPSMGMQLGLDLTMEKEAEFYLNQPGYLLHYWTKHKNLITHAVSLESAQGPYRFEEH